MKDSLQMAIDYLDNGITKVTELTESQLKDFAIQLFQEEDNKSDQVGMLVDSRIFEEIPNLLISLVIPQDPYPSNNTTSDTINSLIRDNIKDKIANTLVKCLVEGYINEMQRVLDYAIDGEEERRQSQHDDHQYTQYQESQL